MRNPINHPLKKSVIAVVSALAVMGVPTYATAASCTWNPVTGNWSTASNWSCGIVPTGPAADSASIGASKVVTVNTAQSIFTLSNVGGINIDAFSLTLQGGGSTTNTGTINVGGPSTAALQVGASHNINNTSGVINVGNGSVINQFGSSITGGTINTTGTGKLVASNSSANFLNGVSLSGNLDLASGTSVERVVGGLTLNGTVNIGNNSILAPQGDQTIGGSGTIFFADANSSNRLNVEAGNLTLGSGITVRGNTGIIGQQAFVGGAASLTNNGTIAADVAGGTITLGVNGTVTNNGTLTALNGGTLVLNNSIVGNLGSQITVGAGSTILQNGVTLNGVINNAGTGSFRTSNNGNNYLNAATFTGVLDLASATGVERVVGGLTLNGTVNIGNNSILAPQGDQTIGGSGNIVFADGYSSNRLNVEAGNLTLNSGITVHGNTGTIGSQAFVGGAASLTNNGTIAADVAGGTITLGVNGTVTNNGTLTALNGGTLVLNNSIVGNLGSQITVGAGSTILQNGVTLNGVINNAGTGSFRTSNNGNNYLNAATFTGVLDLASATGVERVVGGLTLNGTVNIGNNSILAPQGDQTIGGTGTIFFADANSSNRLNVEAGNFILGSGITVRGNTGIIGQQAFVGGAASLTNNGTIAADVAGGAITIQVNGLTTNNGTLAAQNGGTLNLNSSIAGNTGSQILAGAGSVVNQNGVTISGDMNLTGSGSFRASNSGSNVLSGVTLSGALDLASATGIERLAGGLTLNGSTINIGNNSTFAPQGDQTIGGTGTIFFADANSSNRLNVEAGNLILGPGITVRGGNGVIGQQSFAGGAATLTNQGVIAADVNGRSISLSVNGSVINQSTMRAQNGGQLILNTGGGYDNSAGTILADVGSSVLLNSAIVTGGSLNSNGNGKFIANNSSTNLLNGVTLNGVLDMATATGIERITANGMVLNGTINIGNNSILAPQGNQTISGTGNIVFADANSSNRLNVEAGNLVIGSGVTVHGQTGIIGQQAYAGGAATLTNNGTFNADAGGTITVNVNGALTNNGTMRAQNGTLTIQNALTGSGTLRVDPTGIINLTNAVNTQGQLVMGAAGSTLNMGTQNLTINNDYTNVAAGSGNSFNRRAGVSGAGLILAGGNAAQAITGAGVSNGSTANATLTLGNVRVGSTTFNYQVANTGSTGPTLRGAIQTNVNGANLTDSRLSGAGVTASNYNTGAPGSNTGNIGVTFTAASAGALAPLSGQVLNLSSNFDNIANQKLNIVLGAGAAAYNAANGNATPNPVIVANQRIGDSNTAGVTVANTAASGSFSEDLLASIGGSSGAASGSGSIAGRLAGTNNTGTGAISVSVNTATAGAKTGTVTLDYSTAGAVNGVSNGLGITSVGNQSVTVNGNVYRIAQGATTPTPINFGNRHVGDVASQVLTVQNTATNDGFSEKLNASFGANTGAATNNGGSISLLSASGSNASAMSVGMDTSSAGTKSGSATLNYASDGTGTSGLSAIAAGNQTINLTGNVYRLASANTLGAINFGNVHVGDTVQQALNIANTAVNDGFSEKLNASFGTSSDGRITTSGSISQLAAGSSNNSSMIVGLNTGVAGVVNGTQTVNFASDGTGTSGLGITGLASQIIGVSGDITTSGSVFRLASASAAAPNPVSFGNVRVGTATDQVLTISNSAINDGFSEKLNASISSNSAPVTATGAFNLLGPQATDSTNLHVGIDTSSAGAKNGSATIALVSDGTGTSNLGTTNLPSQTVNVSGNVYRLASPTLNTSNVSLVARVGDTAPSANVSVTNSSPDSFTEGLKASIGGTASPFTSSGSIANLAAQGTDASSLKVGLNTATAGTSTGTATVNYISTGAGTTNAADVSIGSAAVNLIGKVYQQAVAQVNTLAVNFGIVHRGDSVSPIAVSVTNAAPAAGLNDTLQGTFAGAGGVFSASGNLGAGLGASVTDSSSLKVGLNTSANGLFSGSATATFVSHDADQSDLVLGGVPVTLGAQVNDYAKADLAKAGGEGSLARTGQQIVLDFGSLILGSGMHSASLNVLNNVIGYADLLDGIFSFIDANDFLFSGFNTFSDLAAGGQQSGLGVAFDASGLGSFSDSILLASLGHNASGYSGALGDITLLIKANVIAQGGSVPEPESLLLMAIGLLALLVSRRRIQLH